MSRKCASWIRGELGIDPPQFQPHIPTFASGLSPGQLHGANALSYSLYCLIDLPPGLVLESWIQYPWTTQRSAFRPSPVAQTSALLPQATICLRAQFWRAGFSISRRRNGLPPGLVLLSKPQLYFLKLRFASGLSSGELDSSYMQPVTVSFDNATVCFQAWSWFLCTEAGDLSPGPIRLLTRKFERIPLLTVWPRVLLYTGCLAYEYLLFTAVSSYCWSSNTT